MARNLNKAGRGLNLVIINATSKEVLRVGHFDTYGEGKFIHPYIHLALFTIPLFFLFVSSR